MKAMPAVTNSTNHSIALSSASCYRSNVLPEGHENHDTAADPPDRKEEGKAIEESSGEKVSEVMHSNNSRAKCPIPIRLQTP